jgi:hypothetical protein
MLHQEVAHKAKLQRASATSQRLRIQRKTSSVVVRKVEVNSHYYLVTWLAVKK